MNPPVSASAQQGSECRGFRTLQLGLVAYPRALKLQESLLEQRRDLDHDLLLLLEHQPVITLGRGASEAHLRLTPEEARRAGIELLRVGRGGEVTFHGPGQLVGYPIVDLTACGRDLHRYLRQLEEVLLRSVARFGIQARTLPGKTGIWVGDGKLASIGVGVRRWIAWHGFALNVGCDLSGFDTIVPCGLPGVAMTSMERLLGEPVDRAELESGIIASFSAVFGYPCLGSHEQQTST